MPDTPTNGIYDRDPHLDELLRGKRVAFVGPAAHLEGTASGSLIDSYDIVARVNQEEPVPSYRAVDYGWRMDILISSCNTASRKLFAEQFDKNAPHLRNLKYVVCTQSTVENNGTVLAPAFRKINKFDIPFHIIGDTFADYIDRTVGCETNTGFNAIMMFLRYPIRELYVTGISFYNMGKLGKCYYGERFDVEAKLGNVKDDPDKIVREIGHNQLPQIRYFIKLIRRYPGIIKIDDYLRDNLPFNEVPDPTQRTNQPKPSVTVPPAAQRRKPSKLEIAVTDYCNLSCPMCSQATPLQPNKKTMSMQDIEQIASRIAPRQFDVIKISGGEPTLHPQFRDICRRLRTFFKADRFELATNGFRLEQHLDVIGVFDKIDLGYYPGRNDDIVRRFEQLRIPNVSLVTKRDDIEMVDVHKQNNLDKDGIYSHCPYSTYRKIVQDRIYPCCVIFGQAIRNNIDLDSVSGPFDRDWKRNLERIDIEPHCRHCWVDVDAPRKAAVPRISTRPSPAKPTARNSSAKLTIFALPKSFDGHTAIIQRNAIASWMHLDPKPRIILLGDDAGVAEAAAEFGLLHIPDIKRSPGGTPLVSDIFARAQDAACGEIMVYVNADIILLSDFIPAVDKVASRFERFLITGRRWNTPVETQIDFSDPARETNLRAYVRDNAFMHWPTGMDYFVFKRGLWPNIPDFAIGRMAWDSWLVGSQIDAAGVVVDATEAITAIHQDHRCGASTPRQREEETNRELAGAVAALGSAECAAWKITADGVVGRHAGEFVRIDNPSVAFTCLDRAYRQNPDRIKRQYEHFIHHVAAGKVRRVIEDAKMHLLAEPDNFAARFTLRSTGNQDAETALGLFNKGLTALRTSQVDQALTYLREALSYNVRVPNLHYTMAVAFGQMNDLGSAADACRKEVALYPDNKSAHELLQKITAAANRPRQSSRA